MTRRNWILAGSGGGVVLVALIAWLLVFNDDAPPPLTLDDALATTASAATPAPAAPAPDPSNPMTTTVDLAEVGLWSVDRDGSVAGYRIQEELGGIGTNTAVGRTSEVTGSFRLSGSVVDVVTIAVDMSTLVSDDSRRDRQLRTRGLETNNFPEASFTLATPIDLGGVPAVGETVSVVANGALTLHGTTRDTAIALDAQFIDDATIIVVGSVEIVLADFGIEAPTGFSILSVDDVGVFEFQLRFAA